jgi:transporter family protein
MDYTKGVIYAVLAAMCASVVGIFAKIGMAEISPILATAVRSVVMMLVCVGVALSMGLASKLPTLHSKAITMIILSAIAGAASWMFGFLAYDKIGVSKTSPLDKLSVPLAVVLAVIFLGERPTRLNWIGIILIAGGAYLAAYKQKSM